MSNRIVTYRSANAESASEWMAFIETVKGRLGIFFTGETEEAVKSKVRAFWAKEKAKAPKKEAA